ncbi:MAG TPA: SRPBCC family protein [Mycobacteriales bacterium]|nr:SRPBCC family protein [Mycobacteriales bacterium]
MTDMTQTIDVDVPVTVAYNQWTQFESYPEFMDGVEEVAQKTDTLTHWKISIGGVKREFDAEITEQHPDERIAWRSVDGTAHAGVVTFHKLDDAHTRVALQIDTKPEGVVEKVGDALGLTNANAKADLKRFKQYIEQRGAATGAWRGEVPRD